MKLLYAALLLMVASIVTDPNNLNLVSSAVAQTVFLAGLALLFAFLFNHGRAEGGEH